MDVSSASMTGSTVELKMGPQTSHTTKDATITADDDQARLAEQVFAPMRPMIIARSILGA